MVIEFKAKTADGSFKIPTIRKRHVVDGIQGSGRVARYSNSNLFEAVLNNYLAKEIGLPVGKVVQVDSVLTEVPCLSVVKPGFMTTFRIEFEDV